MFVNRPLTTRAVVFIGLLGALSFLLMSFEFPLPFAPAYMKFEISDMPAFSAAFFWDHCRGLGCLCQDPFETCHYRDKQRPCRRGHEPFLFHCLCRPKHHLLPSPSFQKKGALYALVSGSLIASIFAVVTNYYFAIPMYVKLYGIPLETILKMGRAVNPFVDSLIDYLLFTVLPFNLIKYGIVSFLTYLVYKKASVALTEIVNRLDR